MELIFLILSFLAIGLSAWVLSALFFRRVVPTNQVHIVQYVKKTVSYGKESGHGNVYYQWPSWIPWFGVSKIVLPVSVFDLDLQNYEAYDKGRLPFIVDVKAFFRISNSDVAAQRVSNIEELYNQLKAIVQGAVRTVLASNEIEEIMQGRSKFGKEFTDEVMEQLKNWGVETVKNIELMDIRDAQGSKVIHNIMDKKKSHIEMESRQTVANNLKNAKLAEIHAIQETDLKTQEATQTVGLRKVEANKQVALSEQVMRQEIKEQEKVTREREMEVERVGSVKTQEIQKETALIFAEQEKLTSITKAEGELEAQKRISEGIRIEGEALADAEKAKQLAPVQAQITLAKEIGSNESYQKYLITIEQIKANQMVGMEQAKALTEADVKIISNTDSPTTGLNSVMDLFSSKGGTKIGAMLDGLSNTENGKALLSKAGIGNNS